MAWSQSHFLQSLGWATLNSFWQMALLWCLFTAANSLFKLSSARKYQFSVTSIVAGFAWFAFTFFYYFNTKETSSIGIFNQTVSETNRFLNICLISASVAYLALLIFPTYRLFRNWQFVQRIKKFGLQKADFEYRLFVQKISAQLGIAKKVMVYVSDIVKSPVTVGYLKPVVLLPVAALNHLSAQQVEAILLHELSHIRRYDYPVNLMISVISTFLYFNPFVKLFIRNIEEERENCCDQLVLQFGYDKVSYASALLTLEKISSARHVLTLAATGKNYLLSRIEKIVGMEKKKGFKRNQFAGLLAALLCVIVFNSILIIKEKKTDGSYAFNDFSGLNLFETGNNHRSDARLPLMNNAKGWMAGTKGQQHQPVLIPTVKNTATEEQPVEAAVNSYFVNVAADEVDLSLTKEQKDKVRSTIDATKKVYADLQWREAENAIGDVLTEKEKVRAKQAYITELDKKVNWNNIEQNMKAQYETLDWQKINSNVNTAMVQLQLDSLQKVYTVALSQLNKLTTQVSNNTEVKVCPMPDQSIEQIQRSKEDLLKKVNVIKALKSDKKVVRL